MMELRNRIRVALFFALHICKFVPRAWPGQGCQNRETNSYTELVAPSYNHFEV